MASTETVKVRFYVTMVRECEACNGTGDTPEGMACTICNGASAIEEPIELIDALRALGILPRLDQVERTAGRAMYYADVLANGGI